MVRELAWKQADNFGGVWIMKVIKVSRCGDCPYYDWGFCQRLERETNEDRIPEDCILEEV